MSTCCPICYRVGLEVPISSKCDSPGARVLQGRFFRLLERHINVDVDGNGAKNKDDEEKERRCKSFDLQKCAEIGMVSCRECFQIMESFCDLYHQLKTIELRLNWKLMTLKMIMEGGGRVPSRVEYFRGCVKRQDKVDADGKCGGCADSLIESMIKSRRTLIKKCATKLVMSTSFPRLALSKCHPPGKERRSAGEVTSEQDDFTESTGMGSCELHKNHSTGQADSIKKDIKTGDWDWENALPISPATTDSKTVSLEKRQIVSSHLKSRISNNLPGIKLETSTVSSLNALCPSHHDQHDQGDDVDNISDGETANDEDELSLSWTSSSSDESSSASDDGEEISRQSSPTYPGPSIQHIGTANLEYILKCPDCTLTFEEIPTLLCHRKNSESCSGFYDPTKSIRVEVLVPADHTSAKNHNNFTNIHAVINLPQAIFLCEFCDIALFSCEDMEEHKKLHGTFSCNFCDFQDSYALNICSHELQHGKRKQQRGKTTTLQSLVVCPRCQCQSRYYKYQRHFLKEHLSLTLGKPRCPICKNYFKSFIPNPGEFLRHLKSHHDLTKDNVIEHCTVAGCPAYFLSKSQLQHHHLHYHELTKRPQFFFQTCEIDNCPKKCYSEEDLHQHQKLHGTFPCLFCDASHTFAPDLAWHEINAHSHDPTKRKFKYVAHRYKNILPCPRPNCSFLGSSKEPYVNHHLGEHMGLIYKPTSTCQICNAIFLMERSSQTKGTIKSHYEIHHNTANLGDNQTIQKCNVGDCTAYFLTRLQLSHHKRQVHKLNKSYSCHSCNLSFKFLGSLHKHKRKYHEEEFAFSCTVSDCGHRSISKVGLESHIRNCHTSKGTNFNCPECEKPCVGEIGLQTHMKVHKRTRKTWVCEACGKVFKDNEKLRLHSLSHSGPESWKFTCSVCSKKCLTKGKLREHMRTHSKEKPFICQLCGEKYAHRHNLRNHVNSKHGDQVQDLPKTVNKPNMTSRKGIKRKWNASREHDKAHSDDSTDSE